MGSYFAKGGEVSGPFGTIRVSRGRAGVRFLDFTNITGPQDNGATTFEKGNPVYSLAVSGTLYNGTNSNNIGNTFTAAVSVTVNFGNNAEQWEGSFHAQEVQVSPNWDGGGPIPVQLSGVFTGPVTVTNASG